MKYSFKFMDGELNRRLVRLLKNTGVRHSIESDGVIRYGHAEEQVMESEIIAPIRSSAFPSWQVLSCPQDCVAKYRNYMTRHGVPFKEELADDKIEFLLPRRYRPHSWKLSGEVSPRRAVARLGATSNRSLRAVHAGKRLALHNLPNGARRRSISRTPQRKSA